MTLTAPIPLVLPLGEAAVVTMIANVVDEEQEREHARTSEEEAQGVGALGSSTIASAI